MNQAGVVSQKDNAKHNHGGSPIFGVMLIPSLPVVLPR
jgi:hypothetical protein